MNAATHAGSPAPWSSENRTCFEDGLSLRIGALIEERDALEEEIRQLRAAVQIYSEIVRRLQGNQSQRAA
jgi:hypothetical protein